jgi:hypothetical protein
MTLGKFFNFSEPQLLSLSNGYTDANSVLLDTIIMNSVFFASFNVTVRHKPKDHEKGQKAQLWLILK